MTKAGKERKRRVGGGRLADKPGMAEQREEKKLRLEANVSQSNFFKNDPTTFRIIIRYRIIIIG